MIVGVVVVDVSLFDIVRFYEVSCCLVVSLMARRLSHGKNRAKMGHARSILGQKTGISFSGDQTLVGPDLVSEKNLKMKMMQ